jgi:hypothetical protein
MAALLVSAVLAAMPGVASSTEPGPDARTAPAPGAEASAMAREVASTAFRDRDDPRRLAEAIASYREASRLRGGDPAALVGLARAEAFRAMSSETEAREAWLACARAGEAALRILVPPFAEAVDRGEEAGQASARVGAPGAEALYWLALGTMGFARSRGLSAVLSVRSDVRAMMERVAALDDRIDSGGPPRALGAWLASLPAAAGGGAAAARARFERARAIAPDYQLTRVQEAQTIAVLLQDRAGFEARLGEVLAFDDARVPEVGPENRLAKRLARSLLARRDRLF